MSLLAGVHPRRARVVFFCDESGRSGANYLDDQPLHVLAGYVVGEGRWPALQGLVRAVRNRRGGAEVKAAALLTTSGGRRLLQSFVVEANRLFFPVLVAIHKRHYAGIRLASLLLDREYNPAARELRLEDGGAEMVKEAFGTLPDRTLRQYMDVSKAPSAEGLRHVLDGVCSDLRRRGWQWLAGRVQRVRPHLRRVAAGLEEDLDVWDIIGPMGGVFRAGATIDFDAFLHCLEALDRLAAILKSEGSELPPVDVLCDAPQGVEAFLRLHAGFRRSGRLGHLGELRAGDSARSDGLQAADFLAGAIRFVFEKATVPRDFQDGADAVVWSFFSSPPKGTCFLPHEQHRHLAAASTDFWKRRQQERTRLAALLRGRAALPAQSLDPYPTS